MANDKLNEISKSILGDEVYAQLVRHGVVECRIWLRAVFQGFINGNSGLDIEALREVFTQHYRYGDPRLPGRFWNKIRIDLTSNCWEWRGSTVDGYGRLKYESKTIASHRLSYMIFVRFFSSKDGEIDHKCRNTLCCNPDHLELVSHRINVLRGNGIAAKNAQKTHCKRGHDLSVKANLRNGPGRICRICNNLDNLARDKLRRERTAK